MGELDQGLVGTERRQDRAGSPAGSAAAWRKPIPLTTASTPPSMP